MRQFDLEKLNLHAGYKENENYISNVEEPEYTNKNAEGHKRMATQEEPTNNKK